jgi:hypothetical protein
MREDEYTRSEISTQDDGDSEPGVSLRPSEFEREQTLALEDIKAFRPHGKPESAATADIPLYVFAAVEVLSDAAKLPAQTIMLMMLERGVEILNRLHNVKIIRDARSTLLRTDSVHIAQLDWRYRLQCREGSKRRSIREIGKKERNKLLRLSGDLDLSLQNAAAICILLGILDAPKLAEARAVQLAIEARAFLDALRDKASVANDVATRAAKDPAPLRQLRLSEVLTDDD